MEKLRIEDLQEYSFLSELEFSPDGQNLCFIVHKPELEENEYKSNLWILNLENERKYKLTNSGKEMNYKWLNQEEILFTSERDMGVEGKNKNEEKKKNSEETRLFLINTNGGEAEYIDTIEKKVTSMKRLDDNTLVFGIREKIKDQGVNEKKGKDKGRGLEEGKDYHEIDEIPFWNNGEGFVNKKRTHLYSYDLKNKELNLLVGENKNVVDYDISEDGEEICLNVVEYKDKMEIINYLYIYETKTESLNQLTEDELEIEKVRFFNNNILFEATNKERMGINTNKEFYLYNREKEEYEILTDMDKSLGNSVLTDIEYGEGKTGVIKENKYYFMTTEGFQVNLYCYSLNNGVEKVIENPGSINCFDIYNDKIAYIALRGLNGQEIYVFDGEKENKYSEFNTLKKTFSQPEHFTVDSDGRDIDSWIMKPIGFEEGKKYPTILEIHGCPKCVYGDVHFNEMQLLANNGYVVVFSNPSGSSGKGDDFADILGDYGGRDFKDIMNVIEEAINRYNFIDPENLGVTGGSYGGFMTNWVIGHTDKFKAAVSFRSISNWISKFATTDIGYYFVEDQIGGNPWDNFEKLWEHSPMKYADQVDTSTLFIQSREDYRCWEAEAIQMFTSLKYHGVESKLILFEDENHNLSREGKPKQRKKRLEEMLKWFDKYLKDK